MNGHVILESSSIEALTMYDESTSNPNLITRTQLTKRPGSGTPVLTLSCLTGTVLPGVPLVTIKVLLLK